MAGICSTDLEILCGYMDFRGVLGHEFVGVVQACDDPDWCGQRVNGEINLACRRCETCKRGLTNHCPNRSVLGILRKDGCFAEYVTLPVENLHSVPDSIPDEGAVFVEPLAATFQIAEQVHVTPASRVLV
jgi:threonine dehydrogenase-like Zn-dependent dehydrogenase